MAHGVAAQALAGIASERAATEARLFSTVQQTALEVCDQLLAEKGVVSVEELSPSQSERLRAMAKRLVVAELVLITGMSGREAHALVGLALTEPSVSVPVKEAMARGEAPWSLARLFFDAARDDATHVGAAVAAALFGDDPTLAAVERLGEDGVSFHGRPWTRAEFTAALARELAAHRAPEVAEEEARRVHEERRVIVAAHPNGAAEVQIEGPLVTWAAASARIDKVARALRAEGDPRTLDQLRHDVFAALATYGTLPFPEAKSPDDLSEEDLDRISAMLGAQAPVSLQVLVALEDLVGAQGPGGDGCSGPSTAAQSLLGLDCLLGAGEDDDLAPATRHGVAEVIGRHACFLDPSVVRRLALTPGTTLHRIVTDPLDGRCIERTITTYRPDAAMRRQLVASDRYSRAPGSRRPASLCDLDHVVPWARPDGGSPPAAAPGARPASPTQGVTSETNLQALDRATHLFKTMGLWTAAMDAARTIRWTTLLGQQITTRPHDHRQYRRRHPHLSRAVLRHLTDRDHEVLDTAEEQAAKLHDELTACATVQEWAEAQGSTAAAMSRASRVLYGVLLSRGPGALLGEPADDPGENAALLRGTITYLPAVEAASRRAVRERRWMTTEHPEHWINQGQAGPDLQSPPAQPTPPTTPAPPSTPARPNPASTSSTTMPPSSTTWGGQRFDGPPPF